MADIQKKLWENKNILVVLVVVLLIISAAQSVLLVRLYRVVEQEPAPVGLPKDFDTYFDSQNDFLQRFDSGSWDPFAEIQTMRERMERMFDDSHNRFRMSPFFAEKGQAINILPQTDIEEKSDRYIVTMNVPGSDEAEIKVDLEGRRLTVRANTQKSNAAKQGNSFLRMERSAGSFQRSLTLPGPIIENAMDSRYKDGVLTIILPKAAE